MTILDRVARLFGREDDPAERGGVQDQLNRIRDTRAAADAAIDALQRQAEQATQAYQLGPSNPASAVRQAQRHHEEGFRP